MPGYGSPALAPAGPHVFDPHRLGIAVSRLGSGAKRTGKVALAVLATALDPDDVVEIVIQGQFHGVPGVAALVRSKVVLANERFWKPEVVTLALERSIHVQGWQDDRTASVMLAGPNQHESIEHVGDRHLAVEFAQRIRDRVARLPANGGTGPADLPPAPPAVG